MGSFGRKGEKLDMLGTVSDQSLRSCNCHVAVVKSGSFQPLDSGAKFLLATDCSQSAGYALLVTIHQLMRPADELTVLALLSEGSSGQHIEEGAAEIRQVLAESNVRGTVQVRALPRHESIADGILAKAEVDQVRWVR